MMPMLLLLPLLMMMMMMMMLMRMIENDWTNKRADGRTIERVNQWRQQLVHAKSVKEEEEEYNEVGEEEEEDEKLLFLFFYSLNCLRPRGAKQENEI